MIEAQLGETKEIARGKIGGRQLGVEPVENDFPL